LLEVPLVKSEPKKILQVTCIPSDEGLKTDVREILYNEGILPWKDAIATQPDTTTILTLLGPQVLQLPSEKQLYDIVFIQRAPCKGIPGYKKKKDFKEKLKKMIDGAYQFLNKGGILVVEFDMQRFNAKRSQSSYKRPLQSGAAHPFHRLLYLRNARKLYKSIMERIGFENFNSQVLNGHPILYAEKN